MTQNSHSDAEKKLLAILRVLSEASEPLGSATIALELERYGISMTERGVRYNLRLADARGYTQSMGRDGRMITAEGLHELAAALAPERVGFVLEKLELLAFQTTFDPDKRRGKIPINTSLIDEKYFRKALSFMGDAFKARICVSELVVTARAGEKLGAVVVPEGKMGLGTVCSAIINGVLLKAGVPVESKFGGVLEVRDSHSGRFVAIINYSGTSLDPSEQYIRAGMTSVRKILASGNGRMLANFREIPAPSRALVEERITALKAAGINGVYALGNTSEPLCQIPVGLNRVGMTLLGGLNPVTLAVEAGIAVENIAESGLVDYEQLVSFWQL